MRDELQDYMVS